jgi:hypothetical protein
MRAPRRPVGRPAGARTIELVVDFDSLAFTVRDDGRGMIPEDVEKIGQRHATSKWYAHTDSERVRSAACRAGPELLITLRSPPLHAHLDFDLCVALASPI